MGAILMSVVSALGTAMASFMLSGELDKFASEKRDTFSFL